MGIHNLGAAALGAAPTAWMLHSLQTGRVLVADGDDDVRSSSSRHVAERTRAFAISLRRAGLYSSESRPRFGFAPPPRPVAAKSPEIS